MVILKSKKEIEKIRDSNAIVAEILEGLKGQVKPGVTTNELDQYAESLTIKRGARPAFKGYMGYPYSLCTSVNSEVVHGFPSDRALVSGDIISVDYGVHYKGYYGDSAITIPVGEVPKVAKKLINVTREALYKGIERAVPEQRIGDISFAIQSYVEKEGYSVVRDFVGHGIGKSLHEDPQVPNYGVRGKGIKLKPGLVIAIEPMINEGSYQVKVKSDGWTVVTIDGKLSAHFEHTIAITDNGPDILSKI